MKSMMELQDIPTSTLTSIWRPLIRWPSAAPPENQRQYEAVWNKSTLLCSLAVSNLSSPRAPRQSLHQSCQHHPEVRRHQRASLLPGDGRHGGRALGLHLPRLGLQRHLRDGDQLRHVEPDASEASCTWGKSCTFNKSKSPCCCCPVSCFIDIFFCIAVDGKMLFWAILTELPWVATRRKKKSLCHHIASQKLSFCNRHTWLTPTTLWPFSHIRPTNCLKILFLGRKKTIFYWSAKNVHLFEKAGVFCPFTFC